MSPMHQDVAALFSTTPAFTLIAGPCVAESLPLCLEVAKTVQAACAARGIGYVFKASFDKANRTSHGGARGPGEEEGLAILAEVRARLGVPVLTDVHLPDQALRVAEVVDVLQVPAFLCRQTDLLRAAAASGRPVNIKKGQFLAPDEMRHVANKFRALGGTHLAVTERGNSFGYHNLVVDMRGLVTLRAECHAPVVFDATHAVQSPGGANGKSGGDRRMAPPLARAAAAVGIDALFCEVHPRPDEAFSDGPNSLTPAMLEATLDDVLAIRRALAHSCFA